VNENCTFAKNTTYNQPDQLMSYAFGLFWRDVPLLEINWMNLLRGRKKQEWPTNGNLKGNCTSLLHHQRAVHSRSLLKKSKYSVTCSTTRGNITTHATVLQTAGVKRLNWTRAKLQNMPQRVIASYWCILGHGWILTRQMACKTPNRFRNKSNKPRKTIKSNVYLIYRVWGTDAAVLMLNFLHEDSWIYTLLTQTRLIGIYRIYLGTVNNADNLKSF